MRRRGKTQRSLTFEVQEEIGIDTMRHKASSYTDDEYSVGIPIYLNKAVFICYPSPFPKSV